MRLTKRAQGRPALALKGPAGSMTIIIIVASKLWTLNYAPDTYMQNPDSTKYDHCNYSHYLEMRMRKLPSATVFHCPARPIVGLARYNGPGG